ncbi:MAG: DUF1573 domain-containing protein [Ignavibacteriales bacterium]|nr:DUF1573 domain-containing protein [Ignavibacteriales bacterium]
MRLLTVILTVFCCVGVGLAQFVIGEKLAVETGHIIFNEVKHTTPETREVWIANITDDILTPALGETPPYLIATLEPTTLQPNDTGKAVVTIDPRDTSMWGYNLAYLSVSVGETTVDLPVSFEVFEDFSDLDSAALADAPRVAFASRVFGFGSIPEGTQRGVKIPFVNLGRSDLIIRRVRATCGCTTADERPDTVAPGERGFVTVVFNSTNFEGDVMKPVTVITNDPYQPVTRLYIEGTVTKREGRKSDYIPE